MVPTTSPPPRDCCQKPWLTTVTCAGLVVRREAASLHRRHLGHVEEVGRHRLGRDPLGISRAHHVDLEPWIAVSSEKPRTCSRRSRKSSADSPPCCTFCSGFSPKTKTTRCGSSTGNREVQQRVDDAEHRRVGADGDRQRQDGGEGEGGRAQQGAQGESCVAEDLGHGRPPEVCGSSDRTRGNRRKFQSLVLRIGRSDPRRARFPPRTRHKWAPE